MDMVDVYQSKFKTSLALDPQSRFQVYNIRYQVYCQEFAYEDPSEFATPQENDAYDLHSDHCLLTYRPSATPIGCIRLVKTHEDRPDWRLPFEEHCLHAVDRGLFDPHAHPRGSIAEFSRLAITRPFRASVKAPRQSEMERQRTAAVERLGLFLAGISLLVDSPFHFGVAMMETRLATLLARIGIRFQQIGRTIDFHGPRAPFLLRREDAMLHLDQGAHNLMQWIRYELRLPEPAPEIGPQIARIGPQRAARRKSAGVLRLRPKAVRA